MCNKSIFSSTPNISLTPTIGVKSDRDIANTYGIFCSKCYIVIQTGFKMVDFGMISCCFIHGFGNSPL